MFHIALYEPRIAPNTGNIMRLCANNGCVLHLIGSLGFDLEAKKLRRAGLDYRDLATVNRHPDYSAFIDSLNPDRVLAITTRGEQSYDQVRYRGGDVLLFGSETHGLPEEVRASVGKGNRLRIPMQRNSRSLNLSNAVALVSYEAWRQQGFDGGA